MEPLQAADRISAMAREDAIAEAQSTAPQEG